MGDDDLVVDPVITAGVGAANAAAIQRIQNYSAGELARMQTRAEKWIAGLTALTGLLATALVVKGPDTFAKLSGNYKLFGLSNPDPKAVVISCVVLGYIAFALAVLEAYSAAFGNPFQADELEGLVTQTQTNPAGAAVALRNAVQAKVTGARSKLKTAVVATAVGMVLILVAVLTTWIVPVAPADTSEVCVKDSNGTVTKLDGALPTIKSGGLTIVACS